MEQMYADLDIGAGTHISRASLDSMFPQLIHIGAGCIFAPGSMVLAHDASYVMFTGKYRVAPVHIGDRVFVGYGSVILPGVTIGDNVVIGALSVVRQDIPGNSVAAGAPAKVICSIEEYLAKANPAQLFEPDFVYDSTRVIRPEQVLEFRAKVYQELESCKKEKS
jgi:acetyltransferase-like isoleucine patch superfamily enzyme